MNHLFRSTSCILSCVALTAAAWAAELHVAPTGNDSNPGTQRAPFESLSAARDAARKLAGKESVTVTLADGLYYLPETLVLAPADSGTEKFPVIYQALHEGRAVISGGLKLELKWQLHTAGTFKAATPAGLAIDQLFIDGQRKHMARYPNHDADLATAAYQGYAADAFSKERAAKWADPAGGYIHAMHSGRWGGYHYRITGKNPAGEVIYEGGWQNNRPMGMHKEFRMVENIFEELDAPGEWFHSAKTNTLYFKPEAGLDLAQATVEIVRLRHLIEFQGSSKQAVKHITLKGFTFRHAARTFMDTREPLLRSDWTIYRGGAVFLTGTENISILDSEFDQLGGNAIFVSTYNRRALIKGCHIHDAGASGVCFVGDPDAVRSPLFQYNDRNDFSKIDRAPGPKTDNYPAESAVEDCLIHGIGRIERQPAGVQISMACDITVRDSSIYDCARSGINIGDGCWGGHVVEFCDVFDTVLETGDHGSFNSWGRDRFWALRGIDLNTVTLDENKSLPLLDVTHPIILRNNRWRCDHGWDIDLDDGSSNYEIRNNLCLNGGLKNREGFYRIVENNIMVNNSFHPHVWYGNSQDIFRRNIVLTPYKPVRVKAPWGRECDYNLLHEPGAKDEQPATVLQHASGRDQHSLVADARFVDAAKGDYRVADDSPALKLGFKNFPMDQFGVKKASLKAIARTPVLPEVSSDPNPSGNRTAPPGKRFWLGAALHALQGEEYSAYGVGKEDSGVALVDVPAGSHAARAGLEKGLLIQSINRNKVSNMPQFFAALNAAGDAPLKLKVVLDQQAKEISLPAVPFTLIESANDANGFSKLVVPRMPAGKVTANRPPSNNPLTQLTDGALATGYGPVFPNGISNGAYKMDLGMAKPVTAISSWSFNQNTKRGRQIVTIYGSNSATDPGWQTEDAAVFTPLGSIDTASASAANFTAASLRAPSGQSHGTFRWIVWKTSPVNANAENTAWQELNVQTAPH
jgi:hypothetical protein